MPWVLLVIAGLLEIVWAFAMKESHGFTRCGPTLLMAGTMLGSFALLAFAMRTLPLGTAYMIWTGIGAVGTFVVGVWVLGEPLTLARMTAALLIAAGIALMKVS